MQQTGKAEGFKSHLLRNLQKHDAVKVHCERGYRRKVPLESDGAYAPDPMNGIFVFEQILSHEFAFRWFCAPREKPMFSNIELMTP